MTFEEAMIKKAKLPATITYKGYKMKIYLVPQSQADLGKFINHFKGHRINNKTALTFSADKQFTVKGIVINNDHIIILNYNELTDQLQGS